METQKICEKKLKWPINTIWERKYNITKGSLDMSYSLIQNIKGDWQTSWTGVISYLTAENGIAFSFDKVKNIFFDSPNLFKLIKDTIEEKRLEQILLELAEVEKESNEKITKAMISIEIKGSTINA